MSWNTWRATEALATVALSMSLLAGCSSASIPAGTDAPTVTPSDTPRHSPIPTATETAASASAPRLPATDPADPATWLVTTGGIGPAQLGDVEDAESIDALIAGAFTPSIRCEGLTGFDPVDPTSPLSLTTAVSGVESPEHPGWFRAVSVSAPGVARKGPVQLSPTTPEGIGLGTATSDLLAAYADVEPWQDPRGTDAGLQAFVRSDENGSNIFRVSEDRIVSIVATFDLPPAGFCS